MHRTQKPDEIMRGADGEGDLEGVEVWSSGIHRMA